MEGAHQYPMFTLGAGLLGHGPRNWTVRGYLQNTGTHGPLKCEVASLVGFWFADAEDSREL